MEKKVRKKLKFRGIVVIFLTLYLIIMVLYYVLTLPIKSIVIKGNSLTTDTEIIESAGISNYPVLFKTNTKKMKKNIVALNYISDAKIKKNILGKITIEVTEEKVLFYNTINSSYVLTNKEEYTSEENLIGVPTMINFTPEEIYLRFINGLSKIDPSVLNIISEIEYDPSISYDEKTDKNITTDDSRFLLKMNDGHYVYINIPNIEKLNFYIDFIASLGEVEKGVLYLDSDSDNIVHKTFTAILEELTGDEEDELSEETNGDSEES